MNDYSLELINLTINDQGFDVEDRDFNNESKFIKSSVKLNSVNSISINLKNNYGQEFNLHVKKNTSEFEVSDYNNKILFNVESEHKREFIEIIKNKIIQELEKRDKQEMQERNRYWDVSSTQESNPQLSMDALTRPDYFIPGNNPFYLNQDQVNKLVKIKEFKSSDIELKFILKDKTEIKGFIMGYSGHSCLSPSDTFIPTVFKIQNDKGNQDIFSRDIYSVVYNTPQNLDHWLS